MYPLEPGNYRLSRARSHLATTAGHQQRVELRFRKRRFTYLTSMLLFIVRRERLDSGTILGLGHRILDYAYRYLETFVSDYQC